MPDSVELTREQEALDDTPEEKEQARLRVIHYQTSLAEVSARLENALNRPDSSLQQVSLLAAQKMLSSLQEILENNAVGGKAYFLNGLSEQLNLSLFEQIFHLENKENFEEFVLRQLVYLNPCTLLPLPLTNREELSNHWMDRLRSAEQAIQIELTGNGVLRGLTNAEQDFFFLSLTDGTIQPLAFPGEETMILKEQLDYELTLFGRLLSKYIHLIETLPPSTSYSVTREEQRFAQLIAIYTFPAFLSYQYYRCLLDFIDEQRNDAVIHLLQHSQQIGKKDQVPHTGDSDLDQLFGKDPDNPFIFWPTGEEQIYGQEHYLQHFITKKTLDYMKQVTQLSAETTLTVFAFDVSGSMLAHDVPPSRFEYALELQEEIVSSLDSAVAIAQVVFSSMGVVSHIFGQSKQEFLDLLIDSRLWFHQTRHALLKDMFGFTSLGAGLLSSVSLIEQTRKTLNPWGKPQPAQILLFSDGDHNCPPNYYQAAKYCRQLGIDVHAICCAREICVEVESEGKFSVTTLQELVSEEAEERAKKWRFWYPEASFQRILQKQHEIVLNHYRNRLQQNLQRSTGANVEALESIAELTGGHFFTGAIGERGPTTAEDVLDVLQMRMKLRDQIIAMKKKKQTNKQQKGYSTYEKL
ncbi:MAG: VWA domain-containing protein [SAR324 cluster bacterium]|nr:VWA domain-containing protein [SAR324 cluster bacterium]